MSEPLSEEQLQEWERGVYQHTVTVTAGLQPVHGGGGGASTPVHFNVVRQLIAEVRRLQDLQRLSTEVTLRLMAKLERQRQIEEAARQMRMLLVSIKAGDFLAPGAFEKILAAAEEALLVGDPESSDSQQEGT